MAVPAASCACAVTVWAVPAHASGPAAKASAKNWPEAMETVAWQENGAAASLARMVWSPAEGRTALKSREPASALVYVAGAGNCAAASLEESDNVPRYPVARFAKGSSTRTRTATSVPALAMTERSQLAADAATTRTLVTSESVFAPSAAVTLQVPAVRKVAEKVCRPALAPVKVKAGGKVAWVSVEVRLTVPA